MLNPHSVPPVTLRKVAAAAAVGNFVEWFDFAVYGFLATVIAAQFFSQSLPQAALLQTFAVFAVAFALRPLAESDGVPHAPFAETVRQQGGNILRLGAFIALTALSFYMFTTFFSTFLQTEAGISRASALLVSTVALLFAAALCPPAGLLCDRIGRRKTMALTALWAIVSVYPAWRLAGSGHLWAAIAGDLMLAVGAVLSGVVTATLLSEVFPTRARYTASAITYNVAYTIFGGTAPLVATWLISYTGSRT